MANSITTDPLAVAIAIGQKALDNLKEAKVEIERLRAENADLREKLEGWIRAHEVRPGDLDDDEDYEEVGP